MIDERLTVLSGAVSRDFDRMRAQTNGEFDSGVALGEVFDLRGQDGATLMEVDEFMPDGVLPPGFKLVEGVAFLASQSE